MPLTPEEGRRLHVLGLLERGQLTTAQAAEALRLTTRQVRRLRRARRWWPAWRGGARQRRLLGKRELDVAGSWGKVGDEEVEQTPAHAGEQLLDSLHHHRTAPDRRLVDLHQRPERRHPHPVT